MTKIKKIVASLAAALTLGTMAATAYADNYPNKFEFHLSDRGGHTFSKFVTKTNSHDYAQVKTDTGHVSESAFAYLTVYKNETYTSGAVSESKKIVELNKDFALNYIETRGYGSSNCLCFSVGYYGAEVNGTWNP